MSTVTVRPGLTIGGRYEPTCEGLFRAFYSHVSRLRQAVLSNSEPLSAQVVREQLVQVFEELGTEASQLPGVSAADRDEVRYLMTAVADEVFLNLAWPNQEDNDWWEWNLIESHGFKTHVAGERIFVLIQELVDRGMRSRRDLARTYLLALGLGFQGQYRCRPGITKPADVRKKLLAFIGSDADGRAANEPAALPLYTNSRGAAERSASTRNWLILVVASWAGWLVLSWLLWSWLDVRHIGRPNPTEASPTRQ